ncbi:MAG: exopolysaccharide Pel transporter PelG [Planctomycetota bacterium]|jgi:uncharacterized membrane protein
MAGIGFRLQKILREDSFASVLVAYAYSALISSGPWLLSILGISLIGLLARFFVTQTSAFLFSTVIVYTYMLSLILTGPIQMGTTRYIADRLFVHDAQALLPCFNWVGGWVLGGTGVFGLCLYLVSGIPFVQGLAGVIILQMVSLCWIGMLFLSAAKDYLAIVRAFFLGYALSVAATVLGARYLGLTGMLWGFAVGQVALTGLLASRVRTEFPSATSHDSTVLEHWRSLPALALIGLFYNAGIWIDKLAFWFSEQGEKIQGIFHASGGYDTCMFLAYISIVPSMALFLIRIETGFYKHYAAFYEAITGGGGLAVIRRERQAMTDAMRLSMGRLLKLQGGITLCLMMSVPWLLPMIGASIDLVPLMRVALLASFVQVQVLLLMIALLYFNWRREVAILTAVFFFTNLGFTLVTLYLPSAFHGWGYLCSCLVTLVTGLTSLERRLARLEYETFASEAIQA